MDNNLIHKPRNAGISKGLLETNQVKNIVRVAIRL